MQTLGRGQSSTQALESPPNQFLGRGHAVGHALRPPSLLSAVERGQNWIPGHTSSVGAQSDNVPFMEDIVELVIRTTVALTNSCPLIPPLWRQLTVMSLFPGGSP